MDKEAADVKVEVLADSLRLTVVNAAGVRQIEMGREEWSRMIARPGQFVQAELS